MKVFQLRSHLQLAIVSVISAHDDDKANFDAIRHLALRVMIHHLHNLPNLHYLHELPIPSMCDGVYGARVKKIQRGWMHVN